MNILYILLTELKEAFLVPLIRIFTGYSGSSELALDSELHNTATELVKQDYEKIVKDLECTMDLTNETHCKWQEKFNEDIDELNQQISLQNTVR